jgi:cyclomaltodextrinase
MSTSWFSKAIIYHIFVDRFAGYDPEKDWKKPVFMGGNLKGIISKADYIAALGINTVWLSPFGKTSAYHGYHVTDYFQADNRFGTRQDVQELLKTFHLKNIRIILDFVPNHCSMQHPFFQAAINDRSSKYRKWFYFNRWNNKYRTFLHFKELPKFNLENPEARGHLIDAARHWLSMGFDGFRLDHAVGPSHDFWKTFYAGIKTLKPEAVLIGEAWLEGVGFRHLRTLGIHRKYMRWLKGIHPQDIQLEYQHEFDGVLDFFFRHRITEFIAWKKNPELFLNALRTSLKDHYNNFSANFYLPTFIDNHDMNRFLYDSGQSRAKLKMALAAQFNLPQPPIIYYGTETALSHDEPVRWDIPFSDLQARKPMPWDKLDYEMIDFVKQQLDDRRKKKL